jgi:hypothetical protein
VSHWLDKVVTLLRADTADLRELARIAGADVRVFYRGIDASELDLAGQDLDGIEFSLSPHEPTAHGDQLDLDLPPQSEGSKPEQAARQIKAARRQEERAALLLAEFLKDRSRGIQIVDSYTYDKAMLTNGVLRVLVEIRDREIHGKKFSNVQIARKVSGRFAKAEDKRGVLAYFLAKYLRHYPDIREWLRGKSVGKLSTEQEREFRRYLEEAVDD